MGLLFGIYGHKLETTVLAVPASVFMSALSGICAGFIVTNLFAISNLTIYWAILSAIITLEIIVNLSTKQQNIIGDSSNILAVSTLQDQRKKNRISDFAILFSFLSIKSILSSNQICNTL